MDFAMLSYWYPSVSENGKGKFKEAKDQLVSFFNDVIPVLDDLNLCNDCDVHMRQVKEKFDNYHRREERIQLLILIPKHLSREREVSFFQCHWIHAWNFARNAKKEEGVLVTPDSIRRHDLSDELLARVK